MKIVIAPASFKGSLTAMEAAEAMTGGILAVLPAAAVLLLPIADGGEGTAAALMSALPEYREVHETVIGPMQQPADASFVLLGPDYDIAALDMASASGLLLVSTDERNPMLATSYGTGQLIRAALETDGVWRVIIGLGGSATNDCGAGCLQALGFDLLDETGIPLPAPALPADLARVSVIDNEAAPAYLSKVEVTIACDVDNPLAGPRGASFVFGPQKGATPEMAALLDTLLRGFGSVLDDWARGCDPLRTDYVPISNRQGAGAAGGLGAALMAAFPQARVLHGIDVVLDAVKFDEALIGADLVLTGEGRLDAQTLGGKAIHGVLHRAARVGVPVIAIAGSVDADAEAELIGQGLKAVISLEKLAGSVDAAMREPERWAAEAARRAVALISSGT